VTRRRVLVVVQGDQVATLSPFLYTPPDYRRERDRTTIICMLQRDPPAALLGHFLLHHPIEPRRLQRLRAGMRAAGLPPQKHWRCFLGNAMAQQPAFASLRTERTGSTPQGSIFNFASSAPAPAKSSPPSPDWLERYLRAASYLMSLDAKAKFPIIEDPATRKRVENCANPFGDGQTGKRVADLLAQTPLDAKLLNKDLNY